MTKAAPTNYQRDSEQGDGQPQRYASPEVRQFPACIGQALDEQVLQAFLDSKREGIPPEQGIGSRPTDSKTDSVEIQPTAK